MKTSLQTNIGYRIKLLVCIEENERFTHKNELIVPTFYSQLQEAHDHIETDIEHRLKNEMYFRSQKLGFDLVRYNNIAQQNTYLSYRILPVKNSKEFNDAALPL